MQHTSSSFDYAQTVRFGEGEKKLLDKLCAKLDRKPSEVFRLGLHALAEKKL